MEGMIRQTHPEIQFLKRRIVLNVVIPVLRNLEFETRLSLKRIKNGTKTSFSYTSVNRKFANRNSNIWKTGCS